MVSIGVDLGTTNSLIAWCSDGDVEVMENLEGRRKTPSVVSRTPDGFVVGTQAANRLVSHPESTIGSVKRYIDDDDPIPIGDERYTPTELSAAILSYLKESAETALGQPVSGAVITVPAYFDHQQRTATKEAAQIAGLDVLRLLNEPTAACLPYGLREANDQSTVMVYDLGGGTFDVSIIEIADGVFDVVGTDGDDSFGGDDWDGSIVDWLLDVLATDYGYDAPDSIPVGLEERLFKAAREAKHELSSQTSATISLPYLELGDDVVTAECSLSREQFEEMNAAKIERTISICTELLSDIGLDVDALDDVILVGGSTRMPIVAETIRSELNIEPSSGIAADEAVCRGAAIQASIIASADLPDTRDDQVPAQARDAPADIVLLDALPKHLGVRALYGDSSERFFSVVLERHQSIPARHTERGYSTSVDNQRFVEIPVLQSKTGMLEDATLLDEFTLGAVPPRPAGGIEIEVTFVVTADGTLEVEATDTDGFSNESLTIESAVERSASELDDARDNLPDVVNT